MSDKKKHNKNAPQPQPAPDAEPAMTQAPEEQPAQQPDLAAEQLAALQEQLAGKEEQYLRLCAEYDNFRKRSAKEKETLWSDAKGETAAAFLPVFDNLERALKQETADEAFKKGLEMTMTQLCQVLEKLGITQVPALGEFFDPNLHNAVMHVEDDSVAENTIVEVFQQGFQCGEKVIRFAMVKVAN